MAEIICQGAHQPRGGFIPVWWAASNRNGGRDQFVTAGDIKSVCLGDIIGICREGINARQPDCLFCEVPDQRVVASNALAFAILDKYPVTELHTLVISKRHVGSFFDLFEPERRAINQLLDQARTKIVARDGSVEGFNIGINSGKAAGQTIDHAHVHLIPRRNGDVENPRGGVRAVIPGKAAY